MEKKRFDKVAIRRVIVILNEQLKEVRDEIRSTALYEKDIEKRIKELKASITEAGKEIVEYESLGKTTNALRKYRESLEQALSLSRDQFKGTSQDSHESKEMVHVLEFAIETLKKELSA